jgi:hypothetical protein
LLKRCYQFCGLAQRSTTKKPNDRHRRLLRASRERPGGRASEQRGQEFSSFDVACHVTLRLGVIHAIEGMIPRFHRAVSDKTAPSEDRLGCKNPKVSSEHIESALGLESGR